MIRKLLLLALLNSSTFSSVKAEDIISKLKATPTTLIDLGLFKTNITLNNTIPKTGLSSNVIASALLDSKTNLFEIRVSDGLSPTTTDVASAKTLCSKSVETIKTIFGVNPSTGHTNTGSYSSFGAAFTSVSAIDNTSTAAKVDEILVIKGFFSIKDKDLFITCKSPLLSSEIIFEEPKAHFKTLNQ